MRRAGERPHGLRIRALISILWRSGLRIAEALALNESDLEPSQGSILVRSGKGDAAKLGTLAGSAAAAIIGVATLAPGGRHPSREP